MCNILQVWSMFWKCCNKLYYDDLVRPVPGNSISVTHVLLLVSFFILLTTCFFARLRHYDSYPKTIRNVVNVTEGNTILTTWQKSTRLTLSRPDWTCSQSMCCDCVFVTFIKFVGVSQSRMHDALNIFNLLVEIFAIGFDEVRRQQHVRIKHLPVEYLKRRTQQRKRKN